MITLQKIDLTGARMGKILRMSASCGVMALAMTLSGCGGSDSGAQPAPSPAPTLTPTPTPIYSTLTIPSAQYPWFSGAITNKDGSESLLLTTVDAGKYNTFTPPTPIYLLNANADGSVADDTNKYFPTIPRFYWNRNVTSFVHPKTKTPAIWFCNQGREDGDYNLAATPRINGRWGEQDALYVMDENGKFQDASSTIPQSVDFSHGCAKALDASGAPLLIKNTLGVFSNYPAQQIMNFDGLKWENDPSFRNSIIQGESVFFAGSGYIENDKSPTFLFGTSVVSRSSSGYVKIQTLSAPDLEAKGYSIYHGGAIGDLNGDKFDDVVIILSGDGNIKTPFLSGARLAIFKNDGNGKLVYDPSAIINNYLDTDFGIMIRIFDVNFDGKPDVVTDGPRYGFGTNTGAEATSKFLLNTGNGNFQVKNIIGKNLNSRCQSNCQMATYFLRSSSNLSYNLITYSAGSQGSTFYAQTVNAQNPLDFN